MREIPPRTNKKPNKMARLLIPLRGLTTKLRPSTIQAMAKISATRRDFQCCWRKTIRLYSE
ncbi:hypothetical protein UUU_37480 [Klebsiella pneumoniae subsp. pneumoniae DSM 30104 = JCM 1662 = NBRC 14940]|nr:hypothetical protein UUU_37480 [Klebsiella pneumoniae subsp. pneumoniae DSM 30104 = JCM 1662 = NBRC 14940]